MKFNQLLLNKLFFYFLESYAESNCYYRKISKFKRLYELLDDLGSVNIKIADLGNACWEVIITICIKTQQCNVYNKVLLVKIKFL